MNDKEKCDYLDWLDNGLSGEYIDEHDLNILSELALDSDDYIRSNVARLLVNSTSNRGEGILIQLIKDKDSLVRMEACDSLCLSESNSTFDLLKDIVIKDKNGTVRGYAVNSLGDISIRLDKQQELIEFLEKILLKEKVVFTKINIYTVLYSLGIEKYLSLLLSMINTKKYQNRCAVINSLFEIINKHNYEIIVKVLKKRKEVEKTIAVNSTIDKLLENTMLMKTQ